MQGKYEFDKVIGDSEWLQKWVHENQSRCRSDLAMPAEVYVQLVDLLAPFIHPATADFTNDGTSWGPEELQRRNSLYDVMSQCSLG